VNGHDGRTIVAKNFQTSSAARPSTAMVIVRAPAATIVTPIRRDGLDWIVKIS
jgi:hypothetical protein